MITAAINPVAGGVVEFNSSVSWITILMAIGFMGSMGAWLFKIGSKNATIDQAMEAFAALRKDYDVKIAAHAGRFELMALQRSEDREKAANTYATIEDVRQVEVRLGQNVDRVVDRLENISTRLDAISHSLIEAISRMAPPHA